MLRSRLPALQRALTQHDLQAFALIPGPSLYYLTGLSFHLMERPVLCLVPAEGQPALIVPELERLKAESAPFAASLFVYGEDPAERSPTVREAIQELGLATARVGMEPLRMRAFEAGLLSLAAPELSLVPAAELLEELRARKQPEEVEFIREAVRIAEAALDATLPLVRLGMTERELAAELVVQLLRQGSEPELPFQPIVASGPNSAQPHAAVSDRPLAATELLIIDWGAAHRGYLSDLTRTFALGEADAKMKEIHQVVLAANEAGRDAARPAQSSGSVDRAAREVIEAAGYGQAIAHRTGHGLGLEAHEAPSLSAENETVLAPGMVLAVEPALYLPEIGGVRIEDDLLVTEGGSETLSTRGRGLEILG